MTVVERLHSLPGRPCGKAIVDCIRMLSKRQLPEHVFDIALYYATEDPDPATDEWQDTSGNDHLGEPHTHGINCVRGRAAEAIATLIYGDKARLESLRPAVIALSKDAIISVRTCAIQVFTQLLNIERDEAVELFLTACEGCAAICGTPPFERFIHYAVHTHYSKLRELLQFALASDNEKAIRMTARQITLADLHEVDVGTDALDIRNGTETMRQAAVAIYVENLANEQVGKRCAEHLETFFDDDSENVRKKVSRAFAHLPGTKLLEFESLIKQFIESKSFQSETHYLIHALETSSVELPKTICRAAQRIIEFIGEEGAYITSESSVVANSISKLIIRQYEQSTDMGTKRECLDLIDQMERIGYLGIDIELSRIDR